MGEKKNWWVSALDGEGNIVEEWLIEDCTEDEALVLADDGIDSMCDCELDGGGYVEDWVMREAVITIETKSGCVYDVLGLPDGWDYNVVDDLDLQEGA